jgi:hypothetical protein
MSWRDAFLKSIGTGAFSGATFGDWLGVLRANRFRVDLPYWPRAAAITLSSVLNSARARWEEWRYGRKVREATVPPPLFVLGIWRSGTTHLHNLLARDARFACPNTYQVFFPRTFLSTERTSARVMGFFMPCKRPQDNVAMRVDEPQEDEFALCSLTGHSVMLGWAFPRRRDFYDRYLTFHNVPRAEVAEWQAALAYFVQKLSFKYRRPMVLKSPGHTCRIKLLLETFPDARFVHIRRHPLAVFQSMVHMYRKVLPYWSLQRSDLSDLEDYITRQYREVYDAFFEERELIPSDRFHEVAYESLETDPIGELRSLYEALALPDFSAAEAVVRQYLASLSDYRKNEYSELNCELRRRLAKEWRRCFENWGYAT